MKGSKAKSKMLTLHWVPVVDAHGEIHLEASWSRDKVSTASHSAA